MSFYRVDIFSQKALKAQITRAKTKTAGIP